MSILSHILPRPKANRAGQPLPLPQITVAPPRKIDATERLERGLQGVVDEAADRILTLEIEIQNREDELIDIRLAHRISREALDKLPPYGTNRVDPSSTSAHLVRTLSELAEAQSSRGVVLEREIENRRLELSDVRDAHAAALAGLAALPSRIDALCADAIQEELGA